MGAGHQMDTGAHSDGAPNHPGYGPPGGAPVIRTNASNQKVGYDQASGQKVFRVTTTNQKPKGSNPNMLSKQRSAIGT